MKRRIEQLLNGIFEYETPKLQISVDKIEAKVREGKTVRGTFQLENPAQKKVKGFLYAESPRVAFEPATFSSISEKVLYEIDTKGMEKGDVLEGKLTIRTAQGEVTAHAGEGLLIPRGTEIHFSAPEDARFLYVTYPADWQNQA